MLDNASHRPMEADVPRFSAKDYFLGIAQRAVSSKTNTRVVLPGRGEIIILPSRNEFHATVPDMAGFCQAPAAQFSAIPLGDNAPVPQAAGTGRNIKELLWQAGFYASQGRLLEELSKYDVVQFSQWPNLTRLPVTPNTMRLCALLTRYPTTITLVHRKLGAEPFEIYQNYSAAHSVGITKVLNRKMEEPETVAEAQPKQERSLLRSLFNKISGL